MGHTDRAPLRDRQNEARLATECLKGSRQAWNELYAKFDGLIRVTIRRQRVIVEGLSEDDLVQETYIKIVKSLPAFDANKASLRTFVCLVAKGACIDCLRRATAERRAHKSVPLSYHEGDDNGSVAVSAETFSPDEALLNAEQADLVRLSLNSLKQACRELLQLRFNRELPYKKMAQLLGRKSHTVNIQVLRCLAELRGHYDELVRRGGGA